MKATRPARRLPGLLAIAAIAAVSLTACGSGHGKAVSEISTFHPTATSSAEQAGATDAQKLFGHCVDDLSATQQIELLTSKTARDKVLTCGGVPVGETAADKADRKTAEACALGAVEKGGKLPRGREAKETTLISEVYPCVAQYQSGVAGTPDPSGTAKAAPAPSAEATS